MVCVFLPNQSLRLKLLRKILLYLALATLVGTSGLMAAALLFSDQIIAEFIRQANTRLTTRITVNKTSVNVFSHFPYVALEFHNVYVEDTHPGQYPLLTAERIAFTFNVLEVLRGNYTVKGLVISESEVNLKINKSGQENFNLFSTQGGHGGSVAFALHNIYMQNCRVHYADISYADHMIFYTDRLMASLKSEGDRYTIYSEGQVTIEKFNTGTVNWPAPRAVSLRANLTYSHAERRLVINPSELQMSQALFAVHGNYTWKANPYIQLAITGKNTSLQTLAALLPENRQQALARYQSSGNVYFNMNLQGTFTKNSGPALEVRFGLEQARIYHPDYRAALDQVNLKGNFVIQNLRKPETAKLTLENITGSLNNKNFAGSLNIINLNDPEIKLNFNGEADVASVFELFPVKNIREASGVVSANLNFEGKTSWLKNKSTVQKISALGSIDLKNVSVHIEQPAMALEDLTGTLQFSRNDLALSNVSGQLGESDFKLNGFFKNIFTWLLFENQPLGIEADLQASHINLAQLFEYAFAGKGENSGQSFTFSISPLVNLKFVADVQSLRFNRFHARHLKGDLSVSNQMALSKNISFSGMGGRILLTGSLDARNPKVIGAAGGLLLEGVHLDSAFYVFNNFGQTFLEDRHLKGQAYAEVMMDMKLKPDLTLFSETLTADITATIKNGELNNFEPLQKLSRYVGEANLNALRFADLKNDIHIERSTVFIPLMEVISSASVMQISGTHRFDQQIDYRIVTPLQNKGNINLEEATGAIEEMEGRAKLFLKITGTTSNYSVQYDTDAVRKKIVSDLKREVLELKELFKKKQKKKEAELSKEEFDW